MPNETEKDQQPSIVVTATIEPIRANKLRIQNLVNEKLIPEAKMATPLLDIFCPKVVSWKPLEVTEESLQYAQDVAEQVFANMDRLSHSKMSGDILALSLAVLHYRRKEG